MRTFDSYISDIRSDAKQWLEENISCIDDVYGALEEMEMTITGSLVQSRFSSSRKSQEAIGTALFDDRFTSWCESVCIENPVSRGVEKLDVLLRLAAFSEIHSELWSMIEDALDYELIGKHVEPELERVHEEMHALFYEVFAKYPELRELPDVTDFSESRNEETAKALDARFKDEYDGDVIDEYLSVAHGCIYMSDVYDEVTSSENIERVCTEAAREALDDVRSERDKAVSES